MYCTSIKNHLPKNHKYISLSDFIKLPFGCVLKFVFDRNGQQIIKTFSNNSDIDNIIIVFDHRGELPLPT